MHTLKVASERASPFRFQERPRFPSALIYDLTANDTSHFGTLDPTVNSSATRLAIANDLRLISGSR